ncbi:hypothetical protein [Sphingomicrobium aestuariivivum]|uniref:hypothetical protein n=1 Tax=Sphingomicrobium aestuariivivum TaxID=1582356 RepID=UPI001FD66F50|nr:hypothetical protein [Sphingomicrobium aestuariivivum]MCJ8191898.1 hypothetical protein [Sphingomicrobium aestuariivivum]
MKTLFAIAAAFALSGPALATDPAPVALSDSDLDRVTAGDLLLPNGQIQFEGIDGPGKDATNFICTDLGMCHSTFLRSLTAVGELVGKETGSGMQVPGIEGPWAAGRVDNPIECVDCP